MGASVCVVSKLNLDLTRDYLSVHAKGVYGEVEGLRGIVGVHVWDNAFLGG